MSSQTLSQFLSSFLYSLKTSMFVYVCLPFFLTSSRHITLLKYIMWIGLSDFILHPLTILSVLCPFATLFLILYLFLSLPFCIYFSLSYSAAIFSPYFSLLLFNTFLLSRSISIEVFLTSPWFEYGTLTYFSISTYSFFKLKHFSILFFKVLTFLRNRNTDAFKLFREPHLLYFWSTSLRIWQTPLSVFLLITI